MKYIERKNGYVYLVKEDSTDGRFKTYYNMGKDSESELWKDEIKPKKTKKSEDNEQKKEDDI